MPTFDHLYLLEVSKRILIDLGATEKEAQEVSEHLVNSNLTGHDSHGIVRLPNYRRSLEKGKIKPGSKIEIEKDDGTILTVDGNWGFGQVVAKETMEMAISRAKETGVCSLAVCSLNHVGRLGEYGEMAARENTAAIISVGGGPPARTGIAPYGAKEARMTTIPTCFAVPGETRKRPIVLDICCGVYPEGKVRIALHRGEQLPEGVLIDADGNPTQDPNTFYDSPGGSILPFGEHKGYGLAVFVNIMAGILSGVGCANPNANSLGMSAVLIDVEKHQNIDWVAHNIEAFRQHLKSASPLPGVNEIMLPYEPELKTKRKLLKEGIYIEDKTWEQILTITEELGIVLP